MTAGHIFCLMGPTASGKTQLALSLVKQFPMEIVSVDSAMVYRGLDIGTAKPDAATLAQIPHHLINCCDPKEMYSAARFCEEAEYWIRDIFQRGKIPLLVGGTMLYFRALQQGLSDLPSANQAIRAELLAVAAEKGWPALHAELASVDPIAAAKIHSHDAQRIQRALEVYRLSGARLSAHHQVRHHRLAEFSLHYCAIAPTDRAVLHARIAQRFQQMLAAGFVAEVQRLYARGDLSLDLPAIRSAGYRQAWAYLAGELTLAEMAQRAVIATRQLAKRQLTWLRHWPNCIWFDSEDSDLFKNFSNYIDSILSNT